MPVIIVIFDSLAFNSNSALRISSSAIFKYQINNPNSINAKDENFITI